MSYPAWRSKEDMIQYIEYLDKQLALSTEREERYRKALEFYASIETWRCKSYDRNSDYYPEAVKDSGKIARQALSSSPVPEPVTVEELAQEIAFSYEGCSILKDSFYLNTAKHLLTKFKIERKP